MIRIFLSLQNQEAIENNHHILKYNYRSRRNYNIEISILKKYLIYNNSILLGEPYMHNSTGLQVCYNRQLPNYTSIMKESVRIEYDLIYLFTKVLPVFKYYIYTSFGISE